MKAKAWAHLAFEPGELEKLAAEARDLHAKGELFVDVSVTKRNLMRWKRLMQRKKKQKKKKKKKQKKKMKKQQQEEAEPGEGSFSEPTPEQGQAAAPSAAVPKTAEICAGRRCCSGFLH